MRPESNERHELDLLPMVAGLVFVAIAASYGIARLASASFDASWVLPMVLIGGGLMLVAAAVRRFTR